MQKQPLTSIYMVQIHLIPSKTTLFNVQKHPPCNKAYLALSHLPTKSQAFVFLRRRLRTDIICSREYKNHKSITECFQLLNLRAIFCKDQAVVNVVASIFFSFDILLTYMIESHIKNIFRWSSIFRIQWPSNFWVDPFLEKNWEIEILGIKQVRSIDTFPFWGTTVQYYMNFAICRYAIRLVMEKNEKLRFWLWFLAQELHCAVSFGIEHKFR